MIRRLLILLGLLAAWATPARADDVAAAGRGVVRVVTIATADGKVIGFGHGSGFAVDAHRIVTNAHVVELAARYPANVVIGVVPSEGARSYTGRMVAYDPRRDLALIEFAGAPLAPLAMFAGAPTEGDAVTALGYPGNVDLATAQSASDYIRPSAPIRSEGVFSARRTLTEVGMLLHTASIARGNSGGPLLDRCGRVLGVNSAFTKSEEGDASFAFAIADAELTAFLAEQKQAFATTAAPCTSMQAVLDADRARGAEADAATRAQAREADLRDRVAREEALARARAAAERTRENVMAAAAVLLVLGALALGGAGLLASGGRRRPAMWTAAAGGGVIVAAVVVFLLRPSGDVALPPASATLAVPAGPLGRAKLLCTLVPGRSRVILSATAPVPLDWGGDGCMNGRTQYAEAGARWQRILVPAEEQAASVLEFDPKALEYTVTRYLPPASAMEHARRLRGEVKLKACSTDQAARGELAAHQSQIAGVLGEPSERLVYGCKVVG